MLACDPVSSVLLPLVQPLMVVGHTALVGWEYPARKFLCGEFPARDIETSPGQIAAPAAWLRKILECEQSASPWIVPGTQ